MSSSHATDQSNQPMFPTFQGYYDELERVFLYPNEILRAFGHSFTRNRDFSDILKRVTLAGGFFIAPKSVLAGTLFTSLFPAVARTLSGNLLDLSAALISSSTHYEKAVVGAVLLTTAIGLGPTQFIFIATDITVLLMTSHAIAEGMRDR